ncbi:MAG: hypothetical protein ACO1SV_17260 [Fimbriimonas sp.]
MPFNPALLIPVLGLMIPIVAILTTHQQKMAQLIHNNQRNAQTDAEIAIMKEELRTLRETVMHQTLLMESINSRTYGAGDSVADRLRTKV